ncbi:MAG: sialate O-acetylesterase [Verrucomicrobia bacterium]|nr:sialate O-acetylesterase [Verrucomicrobiota bacterium]
MNIQRFALRTAQATGTTALLLVLTANATLRADVKLPALFSDNAVLQQGKPVPVWGWADDGEKVTVEFRGEKASAVAKGGKWMVKLPKLKAGGPDVLTVTGQNKIELKNVLVGEVWVASGQSNMEWPLRLTFESEKSVAASANSMIRLFTVPKLKAEKPVEDVNASWKECGPPTITNFSAVAYFFGRDLQKSLGVPIGLIHTSWGGSPAEVWMSDDVLQANPDYKKAILDGYVESMRRYETALAQFNAEQAGAKKQGKPFDKKPPGRPFWKPSELYNGMIAPLLPFAIQGAIWYQGESNAGRAHQYRTLFPDMIRNWRRDWRQGDFTFLAVQLAPFTKIKDQPGDSDWAELREAQLIATKVLPKVGMAVITDVGEENDIHPRKKEPVGARLALAARGIAYGEKKLVSSGPLYKRMKIQGDKAVLSFDHVGSGLEARGGELKGFAIAGEDKKFVWAKAEIAGKQVVVSSPDVEKPIAVRYGWANYPVVNLWNKEGMPATPFRTDDFPMITAPKK